MHILQHALGLAEELPRVAAYESSSEMARHLRKKLSGLRGRLADAVEIPVEKYLRHLKKAEIREITDIRRHRLQQAGN